MSEKYPAYLWYPKDVLSSGRVAALSDMEELWYRRALDQSWLGDGIPADPEGFAGWVGRGCTIDAAKKIIKQFFVPHKKDPSKVVNVRQEKERTNLKQKSKVRSEAGRRSGVKRRKQRDLDAEQLFNKMQTKPNIPIAIANEENTHNNADAWGFPVRELIEAFPNITLTPTSAGFIEAEVLPGDETAWANTLKIYKQNYDPMLNRYLPEKTGNLLGVFRAEKTKLEKAKNGTSKQSGRSNIRVLEESADYFDAKYGPAS